MANIPVSKQLLYEQMLFSYETTSKADYRHGQIKPATILKKRTIEPPVARAELSQAERPKYVHTLRSWSNYMPFDAIIKPKDILQTNPWTTIQDKFEAPVDTGREEAQRTRPRLIMTPAVSIDDVEDQVKRNIVIQDMYTTDMTFKLREAVQNTAYTNIRSPLPKLPAPANPIFLPKLKPPYVSTEWRMESVTWDNRQLRGHCRPTAEFWLSPEHKPTRCVACEQTAAITARRKMLNQMKP